MVWKILIIINLILNAWTVFGVICLTKTLDIALETDDIQSQRIDLVTKFIKENM